MKRYFFVVVLALVGFRASVCAGAQGLDAANRSQHKRRGPRRPGRH